MLRRPRRRPIEDLSTVLSQDVVDHFLIVILDVEAIGNRLASQMLVKTVREGWSLRGDRVRSAARVEHGGIDMPDGLLGLEQSMGRQFAILVLQLRQYLPLVNFFEIEIKVGEVTRRRLLKERVVHPKRLLCLVIIRHCGSYQSLLNY